MKINFEVDLSDVLSYFNREDSTVNDEIIQYIKSNLKSKAVEEITKKIGLTKIVNESYIELERSMNEYVGNKKQQFVDDVELAMISTFGKSMNNTIVNMITPKVTNTLLENPDFIKKIALEIINYKS
jgi:hypothetical protein